MASATTTNLVMMISSAFIILFLFNPSFSDAQSDNILYSGEDLIAKDFLQLSIYSFIMQEDCNLVLYERENLTWASNTNSSLARNCYCSLHKNGNLVIYRPNGTPLWASNTNQGQGNYVLILQKDGNVVIYGSAIWATNCTNIVSLNSKCGGGGAMDVVSITNLPSSIIYSDGTTLGKNITTTGRITTRAGRVA